MDIRHLARSAAIAQAMREQIRRTGKCGRSRLWMPAELAILRRHYPDVETLVKLLPERTRSAIRLRGGPTKKRGSNSLWTPLEVSILRRVYNDPNVDLKKALPKRSMHAICHKLRSQRIARKRRIQFVKTGLPLTDEIRSQARRIGWTLIDLDYFARTRKYFQTVDYERDTHPALLRAVAAMGGKVQVIWPDDF